ncbi:uncharacterized protein LOC108200519 isoform X1 [Daucus carota subsp. sativus]|uniref:uncharacterized protein LOC108200519 isoform X1 n=1 Tax=Daucus carota subsp. sativus TaxID=79200 RepID=UPI0030826E31
MELLLLKVRICLVFGTMLFFLFKFGSCKRIPNFAEGYISEPYFEKYGSLHDSYFQDFLAHEVPLGLCEVFQNKINSAPKLSILHRRLIGEGSHRRLSTSIQFEIYQESVSNLPDHYCEAIIIEKLPSGVFADPFELQDLLYRGVYMKASAFGDTNLELPSIQSNRSLVEIHMDIGSNALTGSKHGMETKIELPIHARYPPLGDRGYSRTEFGLPDLFTRCSIKGKSSSQSCIFMSTDSTAKVIDDSIVWEVPSGNKKHASTVSFLTFVSAILSALSIVLVSIRHSNFETDDMTSLYEHMDET